MDLTNLSFGTACLISLICMLIVFSVLFLLWGLVALMNGLVSLRKPKKVEVAQETTSAPVFNGTVYTRMEDVKDEDMMVAALVATIDYHDEIKEDVRVVSIKEL